MAQKQTQVQIQTRIRMLDDVFHIAIIALERLETYLLQKKGQQALAVTAVGTERDLHDDVATPPDEERIFAEMQLQCTTLWFQTKTDDDEYLKKTVKYFVEDLFAWYGGRQNLPFDEVEMFFVPLMGALSRQITAVTDITATVKKYVTDRIKSIDDLNAEEKETAVYEGFMAYLKGQDKMQERKEQFELEKDAFELTAHKRGTLQEGYNRLSLAMKELYPDDVLPAKFLEKVVYDYLSELLLNQTPDENLQTKRLPERGAQETVQEVSDNTLKNENTERLPETTTQETVKEVSAEMPKPTLTEVSEETVEEVGKETAVEKKTEVAEKEKTSLTDSIRKIFKRDEQH